MFALTPRLLLRPAWPEDTDALFTRIADEGIVRNLARAPWPYNRADAQEFCARDQDDAYPSFLVFRRSTASPELVGACGLSRQGIETELGYWIARDHWGQGYATEAAKAVIAIARALRRLRIVASHYVDNPASGRVLAKLGFEPTGQVTPRYSAGRGEDAPSVEYAIELAGSCDGHDDGDDSGGETMRSMAA